jgi:hypothetical protein
VPGTQPASPPDGKKPPPVTGALGRRTQRNLAKHMKHIVQITAENSDLSKLKHYWGRPEFTADDGIGSLESLYQAGDAIIAIAGYFDEQLISVGSGVMIAPGLMITATHVLDEFPRTGSGPVFLTFLEGDSARVWLPTDVVTASGLSEFGTFGEQRKKVSDLSLVSCALHSGPIINNNN